MRAIPKLIHSLISFPLSPNQRTAINFVGGSEGPPRPRLEDALNQKTIVSLADISTVKYFFFRRIYQLIREVDCEQKLSELNQVDHLFDLLFVLIVIVEVHFFLVMTFNNCVSSFHLLDYCLTLPFSVWFTVSCPVLRCFLFTERYAIDGYIFGAYFREFVCFIEWILFLSIHRVQLPQRIDSPGWRIPSSAFMFALDPLIRFVFVYTVENSLKRVFDMVSVYRDVLRFCF